MLELKEYTKQQVADYLNISASKTSNITKKLKSLGYGFDTEGRGSDYRIHITSQPQTSLKEFFKQFNIKVTNEEKLAHLLNFLLSSGTIYNSYRTIAHSTYYCYHTVEKFITQFIDIGLLAKRELEPYYYATKKQETTAVGDKEMEQYYYIIEVKEITADEYDKAYSAYYKKYNELMVDIETNPDLVEGEVIVIANWDKKAALDGWWVCGHAPDKLEINEGFPMLQTLLSLLEQYKYEYYNHQYIGNYRIDAERIDKRQQEWEKEKMEKRKRLQNYKKPVEFEDKVEQPKLKKIDKPMEEFESVLDFLEYIDKSRIWVGGFRENV